MNALNLIDAISYGFRVEVQNKDGSVSLFNPDGPVAKLKEDTDGQEQVLENIISAVLTNESSFDSETVWHYSKFALQNPDYTNITDWASAHLKKLASEGRIRILNTTPFTNNFITYGK